MILELFSRIMLSLAPFTPSSTGIESNSSSGFEIIPSPNNLSIPNSFETWDYYSWTNDTVTIDNPYFHRETSEDYYEDSSSSEFQHAPITLPICCATINPDSDEAISSCPIIIKEDLVEKQNKGFGGAPLHNHDHHLNLGATSHWYPSPYLFPSENRSHYQFEVRRPRCSAPLVMRTLSIGDLELENKQGRFLRNGYYGFNNKEFYSPYEYCINGLTGEFVQIMICESPVGNTVRLQKCCNPDEIYSFSRRSCIKSKGALFHPIFYHDLSTKLSDTEQEVVQPHYHIAFPRSFKHLCMENRTQILPAGVDFASFLSNFTNRKYYSAHFKLRKDGKIMYRKDGKAIVLPEGYPVYLQEQSKKCYTLKSSSQYCIDGAAEYGSPNPFNNEPGEIFLVTCSEYLFEPPKIGPLSFVYGNVMITSSLFSLLTVLAYLAQKQNIHMWTITSYAFSMFLMYVFLGLAHLIRYYRSDDVLKTGSCVIIGIASHLFSLSSFLWLFIMNWDIWWTFRKFRPSTRGKGAGRKDVRHFLTYSSIGWGIPVIITGISTFIHFKYEESSEDDCTVVEVPLPAYGRESCEIKQLSLGVYLYFPAAILLASNLLFFIVTTYTLCRHSRQTQLATKNLERHQQSARLFAKLFFVMGVTRVFEVITWAGSGTTLTWYWALFDIFNVLQAVAIFIIYVCKRDVLLALKKLLRPYFYGQRGNGNGGPGAETLHNTNSTQTIIADRASSSSPPAQHNKQPKTGSGTLYRN